MNRQALLDEIRASWPLTSAAKYEYRLALNAGDEHCFHGLIVHWLMVAAGFLVDNSSLFL